MTTLAIYAQWYNRDTCVIWVTNCLVIGNKAFFRRKYILCTTNLDSNSWLEKYRTQSRPYYYYLLNAKSIKLMPIFISLYWYASTTLKFHYRNIFANWTAINFETQSGAKSKNFYGVFSQNWDIYVRIPPPSLREHHQRGLRKVIINSNWGIPEGDHLLDMEETQCLWTQIVWLLMQDLHNIKPGKSLTWKRVELLSPYH